MRSTYAAFLLCLTLLAVGPSAQADNNPGHLKMALVNMRSFYSDSATAGVNQANIAANLKRHRYFIDMLAPQGVEFIGFPELSVNGYHFSISMTWLSLDGPEVKELQRIAIERGVYVSAGIAERDAEGRKWNTHIVIDPQGRIIARHRKVLLADEEGWTEAGTAHDIFDVKGLKMGIAICADGSSRTNLQTLVDNGAQIIYAPHASMTGGTTAGWYRFRRNWGGPYGWIAQLRVYAALHNNAALFNPAFNPPEDANRHLGWASGAWFIAPDGQTLAQMPASRDRSDSKEHVLIYDVPIPAYRSLKSAAR